MEKFLTKSGSNLETGLKSHLKDRVGNKPSSRQIAAGKTGIEGLRFHDFRHTFASRLVRNGVDIGTVRKLLGHSTLLVTQRYVHSDEKMLRSAFDFLVGNGNLLHPCDMERREKFGSGILTPAITSESMN